MSDETKPNFMRYQRVADVIATEPALKARMGGKTEVVLKPNGDKVEFPKEVVDVTERIHANGHDASFYGKDKIVQLAIDMILHGGNGSMAALPKAEPKIEPAASKTRKKRRKVAVQKPAVQKAAVPETTAAKPKKPGRKRQSVSKVEVPKTAPVEAEKPKVEPAPPAPAEKKAPAERPKRPKPHQAEPIMVTVASPPTQAQNSVVPFAVGCAVNSNLICASQLLEIHDRTLEGKEIKERLDKIIDEINRRTVIPSASRG